MKSQKIESAPTVSTGPEITGSGGEVLAGIDGSVEKISEVVGENANETGGSGGSKPVKNHKKNNKKLEFKAPKKTEQKIPDSKNQIKKELRKSIEKKTHRLITEALKMQNSKNFEPDKLEQVIQEIRYLRRILKEIINAATERLVELYKKFVWKK